MIEGTTRFLWDLSKFTETIRVKAMRWHGDLCLASIGFVGEEDDVSSATEKRSAEILR